MRKIYLFLLLPALFIAQNVYAVSVTVHNQTLYPFTCQSGCDNTLQWLVSAPDIPVEDFATVKVSSLTKLATLNITYNNLVVGSFSLVFTYYANRMNVDCSTAIAKISCTVMGKDTTFNVTLSPLKN